MKYSISLLLIGVFITGCFKDKITPPPKEKEPKKEIKEVPKREDVYPMELNKEQKKVYDSLEEYLNQLKSLDTDSIISMTYPKFFTVFSKRLYRSQILTMTNSSNIDIVDFSAKITKVGEVEKFSEGKFSQVGYDSTIKIYLKNESLYNTKVSLNTLYSILVRKYGRESIHVDTETRVVTIKKQEKMLAIKESNRDWKFIGDNPTYREIYYPSFLPYDILEKI